MATFGDTWRQVRLHVPLADALLVRQWVQQAYKDLADRYPWHFLYEETILRTAASASRTVGVTQDSATVTGAGFVAADVNRQLRVGTFPIYTILSVTVGVDATLDMAYAGTTNAAATATVLDAYARMPADFGSFELVWDVTNNRPVPYGFTQADLIRRDPNRSSEGDPQILVDFDIDTTGRVRYEWWPKPSAARQYPVLYKIRPSSLADTTALRGVLTDREDVLVEGALYHAARWPGPNAQTRNPYFSLTLAREHREEFRRKELALQLRDDDQALKSVMNFPWHEWLIHGGDTAELLRQTDASAMSPFGW
jgi:hypothetical protein